MAVSSLNMNSVPLRPNWRTFALIGGLLLFCGLAFALFKTSWRPVSGVTLSFIGFTNQEIKGNFPQFSILLPKALLRAKNTGSVPVELSNDCGPDNLSTNGGIVSFKDGFCVVDSVGLARVLKPGESKMLTVTALAGGNVPWSTEVQYYKRGLADRFWLRLWTSRVAPLQTVARRFGSSSFHGVSVKFGPVPLPAALAPIPLSRMPFTRPPVNLAQSSVPNETQYQPVEESFGALAWDHGFSVVVLAGAAASAVLTALSPGSESTPTTGFSSGDLREIRAVIASHVAPWSSFTLTNLAFWPALFLTRGSVGIINITENNSSIGRTTIYPDGTVERRSFPSFVKYHYKIYEPFQVIWHLTNHCSVIKMKGRWRIDDSLE